MSKNIRVREAAEYVGLTKSTLDKMRVYGGGPIYLKLGRSVVYSTADLDAWMTARRRDTTWSAPPSNDNRAARAA